MAPPDITMSDAPPSPPPAPPALSKTGYCYDPRMALHATQDTSDDHPEDPKRISRIYEAFCAEGLVYDETVNGANRVRRETQMRKVLARCVTEEEVCLVHKKEHLEFLKGTEFKTKDELRELTETGDSVYFNPYTWQSAQLSCGGAIEVCDQVVSGNLENAFAIVRPPGHHAEPDCSGGFCHLNNVAVAAKAMRRKYKLHRILILDWDVHHGNGTQTAFYDDPSVLYISIHRHENGNFYPAGDAGSHLKCGDGPGLGYNVNIPWPCAGMGDGDYMYAFNNIIMPIAHEYNPDLVIISSGFDAAAGDKIGECLVSPDCYAHMTYQLKGLAGGKMAVVLEGGYNLNAISRSAVAVGKVLMGETPKRLNNLIAGDSGAETVHLVIKTQAQYWGCFRHAAYQLPTVSDKLQLNAISIDDVAFKFKTKMLRDKHGFHELAIYSSEYDELQGRGLGSPDFWSKEVLVLIFHDAPKVYPHKMLDTNQLAFGHDLFVLEEETAYIDWCIEQGFGVMDITMPRKPFGTKGYKLADISELEMVTTAKYFWENYVEQSDAKKIILLGIGDSILATTYLLGAQHTALMHTLLHYTSFTSSTTAIRPIPNKYGADNHFFDRVYNRSNIYVDHNHAIWKPANIPHRQRYGMLCKVTETKAGVLPEMMKVAFDGWTETVSRLVGEWKEEGGVVVNGNGN